jgi:hypothetical protein
MHQRNLLQVTTPVKAATTTAAAAAATIITTVMAIRGNYLHPNTTKEIPTVAAVAVAGLILRNHYLSILPTATLRRRMIQRTSD